MKVPTFRQVQMKAMRGEKLDVIEGFILDHYPLINKDIKKFMRDLQKLVDFVEDERTKHMDEAEHGA